jgi:hypothetical protein
MNAGTKNGEDANQNANVSARVSSDDIEGKTGSQMTKRTTSLRKKRPPRHSKPDTRRRIPIRNHHQHQISGNVRGTRVRRRGSRRVFSSSTAANRTTVALHTTLQRTSLGASATLKGPDYEQEECNRGVSRVQRPKATAALSNIPPGLSVAKPKPTSLSRPTLAQLHARMNQRSSAIALSQEAEEGKDEGKCSESDTTTTAATVTTEEENEEEEYKRHQDYERNEDNEEYEEYEEYEEEDSAPPPLFVSHVDVLWRIDSVEEMVNNSNEDGTIPIMDHKRQNVNQKEGRTWAGATPVAEELLNDLLDRMDELERKIGTKLKGCMALFGDEMRVVTIISTLSNQQEKEEEQAAAAAAPPIGLQERLTLVKQLLMHQNSSAEDVTNALMMVIQLASMRAELDALEFSVREVMVQTEGE